MTDDLTPDEFAAQMMSPPRRVMRNTGQELLLTTRDKVELALRRELPGYVRASQLASSAGLVLALLTTLLTATFDNTFFGISGEAWKGVFSLAFVGSVVLTLIHLVRWIRRPSMDKLVNSIATDADPPPGSPTARVGD